MNDKNAQNEMSCKHACPFNTLSGCKKDELNNGVCILNEMTTSGWISVKDRLPKYFAIVLVHMPGEKPSPTVREGYIASDGVWYAGHYTREPGEITHWMPLPEPPKEVESYENFYSRH